MVAADFIRSGLAPLQRRSRSSLEFHGSTDWMRRRPGLEGSLSEEELLMTMKALFTCSVTLGTPEGVAPLWKHSRRSAILATMSECDAWGVVGAEAEFVPEPRAARTGRVRVLARRPFPSEGTSSQGSIVPAESSASLASYSFAGKAGSASGDEGEEKHMGPQGGPLVELSSDDVDDDDGDDEEDGAISCHRCAWAGAIGERVAPGAAPGSSVAATAPWGEGEERMATSVESPALEGAFAWKKAGGPEGMSKYPGNAALGQSAVREPSGAAPVELGMEKGPADRGPAPRGDRRVVAEAGTADEGSPQARSPGDSGGSGGPCWGGSSHAPLPDSATGGGPCQVNGLVTEHVAPAHSDGEGENRSEGARHGGCRGETALLWAAAEKVQAGLKKFGLAPSWEIPDPAVAGVGNYAVIFDRLGGSFDLLHEHLHRVLAEEGKELSRKLGSTLLSKLHHHQPDFMFDVFFRKISLEEAKKKSEDAVAPLVSKFVASMTRGPRG